MESLTGRVVGHYRLTQCIDDGGAAPVYRAEHIHYGKPAAVKVLTARLSDHPSLRERFQKEAETITRFRHPNIVRVSDFIVEDEIVALAMALIDGESLDRELTRRKAAYTASEAAPRILPVAAALAQAHTQGGVHGALTPSKVMLTLGDGGQMPRLLGFGVASILQLPQPQGALGGRSNPCWYLAPEQCRTSPALGPAADQYSLAVMLYQLLTGRVPCDGETDAQILDAHLHHTPASPNQLAPGLPPALASILLRALAKNPEGRWPTVDAFAAALREAIPPVEAAVPPPTHRQSTVATVATVAAGPPAAVAPAALAPTAPVESPPAPTAPSTPAPSAPAPAAPAAPAAPIPTPTAPASAAHLARRRVVTWWLLVLAVVVATSATLIVYALMSSNAPDKPPTSTSASPRTATGTMASGPPTRTPPSATDAGVQRVPIPLPRPVPTAPNLRTGSESCDRYLRAFKCYLDRLPPITRGPATTALQKMANTWRNMVAGPGGRDIAEVACKNAYAAMASTTQNQALARGCFTHQPNPGPITPAPPQINPATPVIGIPACDTYLRLYRCFQSKLPAYTSAAMKKAIATVQQNWKSLAATPHGKKGLRTACESALSIFRRTLATNPYGKGCVK